MTVIRLDRQSPPPCRPAYLHRHDDIRLHDAHTLVIGALCIEISLSSVQQGLYYQIPSSFFKSILGIRSFVQGSHLQLRHMLPPHVLRGLLDVISEEKLEKLKGVS